MSTDPGSCGGREGFGTTGPGCHWCLAALLMYLELLPLGPVLTDALGAAPRACRYPLLPPSTQREMTGLVVGWKCTLSPADQLCCSFPSL